MVSTKPMNFEEASFIGHENQFMAFYGMKLFMAFSWAMIYFIFGNSAHLFMVC